jgi:hypothetical protein
MKQPNHKKTLILTLGILLLASFAGTTNSQARDQDNQRSNHNEGKKRNYYSYNHDRHHPRGGYYRYYTPRNYVYYRSHRGYWENRSGIQCFIRID